jgi:hypothetical protein
MPLARVLLIAMAMTLALAPAAQAAYRLVDLGLRHDFSPFAIGEDATVVGVITNNAAPQLVWHDGHFLPLPGPGRCQAFDINANGRIGGTCEGFSIYGSVPVSWELVAGGQILGPTRLRGLDDEGSGAVTAVAGDGSMGGTIYERPVPLSGSSNPQVRAVRWTRDGTIHRLDGPAFTDNEYAEVTGLNADGIVTGSLRGGGKPGRRWIDQEGKPLVRADDAPITTAAYGAGVASHPINDAGQIAGQILGTPASGVIRQVDGTRTDLGNFLPRAINGSGVTVGVRAGRAALRRVDGTVIDVADLLHTPPAMQLTSAQDVNERGDVTGVGLVGTVEHAYVLLNETVNRLKVGLDAGTVGDNDIFELHLSVAHTGAAGTPDITGLAFPVGNGIVQTDSFFGAANAPLLTSILGPVPGFPGSLTPGQSSDHVVAYAVQSPGSTLLETRVNGHDALGDEHWGAAGVKVEATYKTPSRQDLDGLVAGGLITLMDQAVTRREQLAAQLSDVVHKKLVKSHVAKSLTVPTPFERGLAQRFNLPDNALAWLPNRTKATGSGDARKPSSTDVAMAFVQSTGSEMLKVGGEAVDRTVLTPFAFWRDYLFEPSEGDRARVNMELAGLAKDGLEGTKGVLGTAASFYTSPDQMQAAWTEMPRIEAEASQQLKALDIKLSNAILDWDDLMTKDPVKGAGQFGKLLGRIEGEVAVGWIENLTGGKVTQGLKAFAKARRAAGVESEVSEAVGTSQRLAGAGATPVAKAPTLGNLNQQQLSRFQQIVKTINDRFGIDIEIQARPINEFAAKVKGGIGKVEAVPTKNLTPDDVLLGAPQEYLGQTAYYRPKLPKDFAKLTKDVQERLKLRVAEKAKELDQFLGKKPDPTGKAEKVRKALEKGGEEFTLGKNGKVLMELEQTTHKSGAILIRYKKLAVNGKAVFTGKPRPIVSDVDFNAVIDRVTQKALPAGIRGQVELNVMREFAKAAEDGVFPFGYHGWTHSGFDVTATDFRYILKYMLMYMSDEEAARIAAKYAPIYGTTPQEFLDGYTKGKLLVKVTATGSTLGPGS